MITAMKKPSILVLIVGLAVVAVLSYYALGQTNNPNNQQGMQENNLISKQPDKLPSKPPSKLQINQQNTRQSGQQNREQSKQQSDNRAKLSRKTKEGDLQKSGEINKGKVSASAVDYSEVGFDLMKSETIGSLKLGLADSRVLNILGEPIEKSEQIVWGADGEEHQTWHYKSQGIELDMIGVKNKQKINMITISNPCAFKTGRNIGLGSTKEEVLKAYRNEINRDKTNPDTYMGPDSVIAGTIYGGVYFEIKNSRVASIFVGAGAE